MTLTGALTAVLVIALTAGLAGLGVMLVSEVLQIGAAPWSQWPGAALAALILAFMIAIRSLEEHTRSVYAALKSNDLEQGRLRTGMIVGRDTADLPESELVRATVECVAESLSDGIAAPLFWATVGALLGGPVGLAMGAVSYRAINTMDSMFGYRNEHYRDFGRVPARLDDLVNLIPARLAAAGVALAALLLPGERAWSALRIWWRDGLAHSSPNAGQCEAAFAGALNIQLGGTNTYGGMLYPKPTIGDAGTLLAPEHILRANRLMLASGIIFTVAVSVILLIVSSLL
jgi:adenosylcobinamide-phosphate synthase